MAALAAEVAKIEISEDFKKDDTVDAKFRVWDDDVALGKDCPSFESLLFNIAEGPGSCPAGMKNTGKVTVFTFFSKLNKADHYTMTATCQLPKGREDKVQVIGICRDKDEKDVPKFIKKFHGQFFGTTTGPKGEAGIFVDANFPLAFDKYDCFNNALKKAMVKAVCGVGMAVLVDTEGKIRWYEMFDRGNNKAGLLHQQIDLLLAGKPLESWGPNPEADEEEEECEGGGEVPTDFEDPFAATGDGY